MKYLFLLFFIFSFNVYANDMECPLKKIESINQLEQKLNNCNIDYGKDEVQTSVMLEAYDRAINCLKAVAYEIFDKYYIHYNETSKKNFDSYVKATIDFNNNLIHHSDWGREHQLAEVYVLQSTGGAYSMVKDMVNKYIDELRFECNDMFE